MLFKLIIFSSFAGITVFIGGLLANYFNHHVKDSPVKYEITHTMMSFGAGIILAAVALVLIPYGLDHLNVVRMTLSFMAGSVGFMFLDQYLEQKGGRNCHTTCNDDGLCARINCFGCSVCSTCKNGYIVGNHYWTTKLT